MKERQLVDLASLESFADHRGEVVAELGKRGIGLSFKAFKLAHPNCKEVYTGERSPGWYDADGIDVGVPLRQLVATDKKGREVRSTKYI